MLHELTKCTAKSNSEVGPITHGTVLGDANKKTVLWCIVNIATPRPIAQLQNGKYGYCTTFTSNLFSLLGTSMAVMSANDLNWAFVWSLKKVMTGRIPSGAMSTSNSFKWFTWVHWTYLGKMLPTYSPYFVNCARTGSSNKTKIRKTNIVLFHCFLTEAE